MKERIKNWKPLYSTQGICTLCNQKSHECHTMKYGSLCMQAVANYHHHSNGNTLTFSGAKVFIDFYNTARSSWESWLDLSTSLLEGKMSWFCSSVVGVDEMRKIWTRRWSTSWILSVCWYCNSGRSKCEAKKRKYWKLRKNQNANDFVVKRD